MQTLCSKASNDNFSKLFFITDSQYSIIISYSLLTNKILISFDDPLCSLENITFLIISPPNVSKSVLFCFSFGLVNSPPSFFLCFQILLHTCVSLFPFLPQFLLLTNTVTNTIFPPPSFFMSSWTFGLSATPTCSFQQSSFQNVPITINRNIFLTQKEVIQSKNNNNKKRNQLLMWYLSQQFLIRH